MQYLTEEEIELDTNKQRIVVEKRLNQQIKKLQENLQYSSLIMEHCMYVLWSHLDFYNTQALTKCKQDLWPSMTTGKCFVIISFHLIIITVKQFNFTAIDESVMEWRVSSELIGKLKQELLSVFTEAFEVQLMGTKSGHTSVDHHFIQALIRRIKRLLQFIVTRK